MLRAACGVVLLVWGGVGSIDVWVVACVYDCCCHLLS